MYEKDKEANTKRQDELIEELMNIPKLLDEEIRANIVGDINEYWSEVRRVLNEENRNIGFYCENTETGSVITNVGGDVGVSNFTVNMDKDNKYEYFSSNISETDVEYGKFTPKMDNVKNYLEKNVTNKNGYKVYYRIPKNLYEGDFLYETQAHEDKKTIAFKKNIITFILLGVPFLFSAIVAYRNRKEESNEFIEKCYRLVPIEIKVISPILAIANIFVIDWNFVKQPNESAFIFIPAQAILLFISYLFINNIINRDNQEIDYENMKKRSIFYNIKMIIMNSIDLLKGSLLVKSTKIRVLILIGITVLFYIAISFWNSGIDAWIPFKIFIAFFPYVYPVIMIIYILNITKGLNILKIVTRKIVEGNYNVDIKVKGPIIVKDIAANIKNIEEGFGKAIDEAVKSEKLKGELITNVSHDLKTPLTSIISYVDLLKNENLKDEDRKKYINVLDEKAQRLKILIEDLFEASKASSGNLEIIKENIDVSSLLRQTLGEFQEKISASSLEFINKWPEEKAELNLDGKKTWRVFENLISNILKYSMENSRVYIEVVKNIDSVQIVMKNMSAYQLDFTEEEITERFKRGDKSRHTEGSGLGLAIAKSLIELQGGNFKIEIDGDLFKAIVTFPIKEDNLVVSVK